MFTAILALLAGFTQFLNLVLQDHRGLHRLVGRIYAYDVLIVNFPVGMVLALCANGLLPGRIAFVLLDSLWFTFTLLGVLAARRDQLSRHRAMMIRSYALTFSAIMLRTWKLILVRTTHIDLVHLYMIDAWMGFVPNLLVAEWWIRSSARRSLRVVSVFRTFSKTTMAKPAKISRKLTIKAAILRLRVYSVLLQFQILKRGLGTD